MTYYFSQLLLQETLYTDPLNFQYPFHLIEQFLAVALQCRLRCCLAMSKCTDSVIVHAVHLKLNPQGKEEFCPICRCQQRNKKGLSCELKTEKININIPKVKHNSGSNQVSNFKISRAQQQYVRSICNQEHANTL